MENIALRILVYEVNDGANDNFLIDYNFENYKKYFIDIENNDIYQEKGYLDIAPNSYLFYSKIVDEYLLIYKAYKGKNTNKNGGKQHDVLELAIPKNTSIKKLLDNDLISGFLLNENFKDIFENKYKDYFENKLNEIELTTYPQNEGKRKNHKEKIFIKEVPIHTKTLFLQDLITLHSNETSFFMCIGDLDKESFIKQISDGAGEIIEIENDFYRDIALLSYFTDNEKEYQKNIIDSKKNDSSSSEISDKNSKEKNMVLNEKNSKLENRRVDLLKFIEVKTQKITELKQKIYKENIEIINATKKIEDITNEIIRIEDNSNFINKLHRRIAEKEDLILIIATPLLIVGIIWFVYSFVLTP